MTKTDKATYDKQRKEHLKEIGVCIKCANMPALVDLDIAYCYSCREKDRVYARNYIKNPEHRAKATECYKKTKLKVIQKRTDIRASASCKNCGKQDERVIQFHHRDPKTKTRNVAAFQSFKGLEKELAKCDALCADCHSIVEWEKRQAKQG